jgi:hypothetical protein
MANITTGMIIQRLAIVPPGVELRSTAMSPRSGRAHIRPIARIKSPAAVGSDIPVSYPQSKLP